MKRIAIVGGGAGGLFTARLLSERLNDRIEITLFEAAPRLGQVVTGCFKKSGSHLSTIRASTAGCAELLSPEDYYYDGSRRRRQRQRAPCNDIRRAFSTGPRLGGAPLSSHRVRSDIATESIATNALNGIRNVLMDDRA